MENAVTDLASQVGPWLKWIDGNLHVEVRVAVGMENQIVDVWSTADLITTKTRTRRTRKLVNEREERRKRTEWKEQKTINNELKLNLTVSA